MLAALLLLSQATGAGQPDIQLHATVDVRSAKIQSRGVSSVSASADPDGGSQTQSSGTSNSRHFELHIDARIADPLALKAGTSLEETEPQQPR